MSNNTVSVAYCCSDLFSEVCAVSIVSLFVNNRDLKDIDVYILEYRVSGRNRDRLSKLAEEYGRRIIFISMQEPSVFYGDKRFTFDTVGRTYGRMIWGDVLPSYVHRLISLDCDTMVLDNIESLWNMDMEGKAIGGVDDCMGKVAMVKTQHLSEDMLHCNAGMYLINLDVWREENWTMQFKEYITDLFNRGISLGGYEEEVITNTLNDRFLLLPPKYNLMTLEQVFSYKELMNFRQPKKYYTEKEIQEALNAPVITHTTNFFYVKKRIFDANSDHPQRHNYEKYRAMTPWKDDPPLEANYSIKNKIMKEIWHCMPKAISLRIARFIRNDVRPFLSKKRDDI